MCPILLLWTEKESQRGRGAKLQNNKIFNVIKKIWWRNLVISFGCEIFLPSPKQRMGNCYMTIRKRSVFVNPWVGSDDFHPKLITVIGSSVISDNRWTLIIDTQYKSLHQHHVSCAAGKEQQTCCQNKVINVIRKLSFNILYIKCVQIKLKKICLSVFLFSSIGISILILVSCCNCPHSVLLPFHLIFVCTVAVTREHAYLKKKNASNNSQLI